MMIGMLMASKANTAIVQMQDVLGLGSEARMNIPGRAGGNWRWRMEPGQLTLEHAERLRAATAARGAPAGPGHGPRPGAPMGEPCRLGLVALGDSITRGEGEPALGVPHRPWALWLAQALELPYTNHAVNGAVAEDALREQLPARARPLRRRLRLPRGQRRARAEMWDPTASPRRSKGILAHLHTRAERVLALTHPARSRPSSRRRVGREANGLIRRARSRARRPVADLSDLRGPRLLLPDAVHPTALGQLEIADRAARVLARDGARSPALPSAAADVHDGRLARSLSRPAGDACSRGTSRAARVEDRRGRR